MEQFEQILNHSYFIFSIKLCNETQFLGHLSKHLRACLNHPNHKKSPPIVIKEYISI
jgi:hypothetical protein